RAAQALELLFLENAQEFGLKFKRDVAHLVEKDCAPMRQFEPTHSLRDGAGESSLFVPEQFALEEPGRNSGTVHFHECPLAARAQIVDGAGNQFLAGAGLTENENRRIRRRHRLYLFQDFFQGRTFTDDLFEVVFGANLILQVKFLLAEFIRVVHNLPIGERILYGDRYLIGDVMKQSRIFVRESLLLQTRHHQRAEGPAVRNERQETPGLNPFRADARGKVKLLNIPEGHEERLT